MSSNADTPNHESDNRLPTGEWNGFYLESHRSGRGWMSMYLQFTDGKINGEGTDYVGPWVSTGHYDVDTGVCRWVKRYLGKHEVVYGGRANADGIRGDWEISNQSSGPFHIWPLGHGNANEHYLREDLDVPHMEDSLEDSLSLEPALGDA